MASGMPHSSTDRSTSLGSTVFVPGASETSSNPYVGRIESTFERKTRRLAAGLAAVPVDWVCSSKVASSWRVESTKRRPSRGWRHVPPFCQSHSRSVSPDVATRAAVSRPT